MVMNFNIYFSDNVEHGFSVKTLANTYKLLGVYHTEMPFISMQLSAQLNF